MGGLDGNEHVPLFSKEILDKVQTVTMVSYSIGVGFTESFTECLYGLAEIGSGFQGNSLPSSTDLFLEQVTFGLAKTGFDK